MGASGCIMSILESLETNFKKCTRNKDAKAMKNLMRQAIRTLNTWHGPYDTLRIQEGSISAVGLPDLSAASYNFILFLTKVDKVCSDLHLEIWLEYKDIDRSTTLYKCYLEDSKVKGTCSSLTVPFSYYSNDSDEEEEEEEEMVCGFMGYRDYIKRGSTRNREVNSKVNLLLMKRSNLYDFMWEKCTVSSFFTFLAEECDSLPLEILYKFTLKADITYIPKEIRNNIILRVLDNNSKFISLLECFRNEKRLKNIQKFISLFGGIDYDESLKYTTIDFSFDDTINGISESEEVIVNHSDTKWEEIKNVLSNPLPKMIKLSSGVIIECRIHENVNCLSFTFIKVFYHPKYEEIKQKVNEIIEKTISSNKISISSFMELITPSKWMKFFDIPCLLSNIGNFHVKSKDFFYTLFIQFVTDKYWDSLPNNFFNIFRKIQYERAQEFTLHLYLSNNDFKISKANEIFLPILLERIKSEVISGSKSNIPIFVALCCHSKSYELAQSAHKLKYLSNLVSNISSVFKNAQYEFKDGEFNEWEKYFVKLEFNQLIDESTTQKKSKIMMEKQIDILKQKYPYLYLGKRANPSKEEPEPKKKPEVISLVE